MVNFNKAWSKSEAILKAYLPNIMLGNQILKTGKATIIPKKNIKTTIKGVKARTKPPRGKSKIAFAINIFKPIGGVRSPISMLTDITMPNQIRLKPKPWTIGKKKGNVINNKAKESTKQPSIRRMTFIMIMMIQGDRLVATIASAIY